jgi:glutathione-independent formaldehyde dehydrogenase
VTAVSYAGTHKMSVTNHPKPKLKTPGDAILRVTTSGICGSDLHMYDGRTPLKEGTVVGHEITGVIDEAGRLCASKETGSFSPFNIACGYCLSTATGEIRMLA